MDYLDQQVFRQYGDVNVQRLMGKRVEKESSKAAATRLKGFVKPGARIADIGCSSGHLSRTLLREFGPDLLYTGIDIDAHALELGRQATTQIAGPRLGSYSFAEAPADDLPFQNDSFDVTISMNLLEHVDDPRPALGEMLRVTRSFLLIRTLVASHTYIIKEARVGQRWRELADRGHSIPEAGFELDDRGDLQAFVYHNVWGEQLLLNSLQRGAGVRSVEFELDTDFDSEAINADTLSSGLPGATRVIDGRQVEGPLLPPHTWIKVAMSTEV